MSDRPPLSLATLAISAGRANSGNSLAPALWASSTWESDSLDDAHHRATSVRHGDFSSRYANPTVEQFEHAIAELEGAEAALAFGSGMGAIAATVLALWAWATAAAAWAAAASCACCAAMAAALACAAAACWVWSASDIVVIWALFWGGGN